MSKSFHIWRLTLSITFPQGFRKSKKIWHWTLGRGGNNTFKRSGKVWRTNKQTNRQTNIRTFQLIEIIDPQGRFFKNKTKTCYNLVIVRCHCHHCQHHHYHRPPLRLKDSTGLKPVQWKYGRYRMSSVIWSINMYFSYHGLCLKAPHLGRWFIHF